MHEPQYTKTASEPIINIDLSAWERGEAKKTSAPAQLAELEPRYELPAPIEGKRKLPSFMEAVKLRLLYLSLMMSDPQRVTQERLETYSRAVATYNDFVIDYNAPRGRTAKRRDTKPKAKGRKKETRGRRDSRRRR